MKLINRNQSGVTAMQLLIAVVVIIIIAAVIVAPRILRQSGRALHAQATDEIEALGVALDTYAEDNGDYPSTEQELKALWEKPEKPPLPIDWKAPYVKAPIIFDPWGNKYTYIHPGLHDKYGFDLISFGSDGREGGKGDAEDITNWVRIEE